MDDTPVGFLGMKGFIDFRVADILAKQAAMQYKAAQFQAHVAQHESDKAALYTAREVASHSINPSAKVAQTLPTMNQPHPLSSTWYEPSRLSVIGKGESFDPARELRAPVLRASIPLDVSVVVTSQIFRNPNLDFL